MSHDSPMMENQGENQSLQKYEINGTGEPAVDGNDSSQRSNKKSVSLPKNVQSDVIEELSPYALSLPLANRLCALKNPRKFQQGMVGSRVMSAKLIKMKELESEMAVLKSQLHEVKAENKLLRALQHRQDHALKKFEDTKGQLPRLIQSHSEEVRALKAKCKKVNLRNRDLEKRLQNREVELRAIQDQNRHLLQLSKDRNLGERESLRYEADSLRNMLQHMEDQLQEVVKRKSIEQKVNQQKLQQEINLNRELKKSLLSAEQTIDELKAILEENEISLAPEKIQYQSKSPKEVKTLGMSRHRSSLLGQQNQQDAVEASKELSVASAKKIANERLKCLIPKNLNPAVAIKNKKSGLPPKDTSTVDQKKPSQHNLILSDEKATENTQGKLSHINLKINVPEPSFTSEKFYLCLEANTQANNETQLTQVNAERGSLKNSALSSKDNDVDGLTEALTKTNYVTTTSAKYKEVDDLSKTPPKIHVTTLSSKHKEINDFTLASLKFHPVTTIGSANKEIDDLTEAFPQIHHVTTVGSKNKEVNNLTEASSKIQHVTTVSSKHKEIDDLMEASPKIQHFSTISSKLTEIDNLSKTPPKIHHITTLSSKHKEVDDKVSPNIHNVIHFGTNYHKESANEDSRSPNSRGPKEGISLKSDKTNTALNSDGSSAILCDEVRSKVDDSDVQHGVGIDRNTKDKLLKALKAIDQEEWTDVSETSDAVDTDRELFVVSTQAKSEKKVPHSSGKGKLNGGKSCSSGPNSARSKKSPSLRKSAKPDLMHELFGTIPKSEVKQNEKRMSDPSISSFRNILS